MQNSSLLDSKFQIFKHHHNPTTIGLKIYRPTFTSPVLVKCKIFKVLDDIVVV